MNSFKRGGGICYWRICISSTKLTVISVHSYIRISRLTLNLNGTSSEIAVVVLLQLYSCITTAYMGKTANMVFTSLYAHKHRSMFLSLLYSPGFKWVWNTRNLPSYNTVATKARITVPWSKFTKENVTSILNALGIVAIWAVWIMSKPAQPLSLCQSFNVSDFYAIQQMKKEQTNHKPMSVNTSHVLYFSHFPHQDSTQAIRPRIKR